METYELLLVLLAAMLPMALVDIVRQRRAGAYAVRHAFHGERYILKLTGLYATLLLALGAYWLFPEYEGDFYRRIMELLHTGAPLLALLAIPYIAWVDRRMEQPEDGLYHMGLLLVGRWTQMDGRMVGEHLKAWTVKAFFLPLMATFLLSNAESLMQFNYKPQDYKDFHRIAYHWMFSLDLLFACTGYVMTFRPLRTQIYSAEPTVLGWVVCLICYAPFWGGLFYGQYFHYDNDFYWHDWTEDAPTLHMIWGMAILLCLFIYAWASIAFGYRFSNITYRGLITGGPYRLTKHPAYVFKCTSWWLISIPFIITDSWEDALRNSLLLAGVCGIYYLRARTEENHLSNYPEYIAYAEWMNAHGMFRRLGHAVPYLAYSKERARTSGSRVYAPYTGRETVS